MPPFCDSLVIRHPGNRGNPLLRGWRREIYCHRLHWAALVVCSVSPPLTRLLSRPHRYFTHSLPDQWARRSGTAHTTSAEHSLPRLYGGILRRKWFFSESLPSFAGAASCVRLAWRASATLLERWKPFFTVFGPSRDHRLDYEGSEAAGAAAGSFRQQCVAARYRPHIISGVGVRFSCEVERVR